MKIIIWAATTTGVAAFGLVVGGVWLRTRSSVIKHHGKAMWRMMHI